MKGAPEIAVLAAVQVEGASAESAARAAGVRHAQHQGEAACLASLVATALAERVGPTSPRLGVVCNGGPWNLQPVWAFLDRTRDAGPSFVNPLLFPPTLVSNTAAVAAARVGAHAFAFVVGHDRLAFFDVLHRSAQAIRAGMADCVFAIGVCGTDAPITSAAERSSAGALAPVGIGFALGRSDQTQTARLLEIAFDAEGPIDDVEAAQRCQFTWNGDRFASTLTSPLDDHDALGASGAVMCLAALTAGEGRSLSGPVLIAARENRRAALATFSAGIRSDRR